MLVNCEKCRLSYDDAERWTYCPHDRFISIEDLERKKAALDLIGRQVCFAHQPKGPAHFVQAVKFDGMITLADMAGEFAPHLFVMAS